MYIHDALLINRNEILNVEELLSNDGKLHKMVYARRCFFYDWKW